MVRITKVACAAGALWCGGQVGSMWVSGFDLDADEKPMDFFEVEVNSLQGVPVDLESLAGNRVVLVANVASYCGFTDAGYEQLNELVNRYGHRGLKVYGAPCNSFGAQEPGNKDEIADFAGKKGASFELLEKMQVNGPDSSELYQFLRGEFNDAEHCHDDPEAGCEELVAQGKCEDFSSSFMVEKCPRSCDFCDPPYEFGGDITWNFTFFLVAYHGEVVARWEPGTNLLSDQVITVIEEQLEEVEAMMNDEDAHYDEDHDEL